MIQVFQTQFPPQNTPVVDKSGNLTNAGMAFLRALFSRTGEGSGLPNQVDLAASLDIVADWNLTTAATLNLPALTGGQLIVVQNAALLACTVNPPLGATIDGLGSYSLPSNKMQIFWFFSATQIFSTQLG